MADTDFRVEPEGDLPSDSGSLIPRMVLADVWEHTDFTVDEGRPRRKYMEDRIRTIRDMQGKQGTLVIDEGTTEEDTYTSITFMSFTHRQSGNDLLEYDLEFGYPVASTGGGSGGIMLASRLEFGSEDDEDLVFVNSKNMVIELTDDGDKTIFKEIFRAAPIRVQGAVPLKIINVLGIIDKNVPSFWSMLADSDAGAAYRANKVLDPTGTAFWRSANTALPHTLRGYRGNFSLFKVYSYGIVPEDADKAPASWTLQGSVDGTTGWTTIDTQSSVTGWVTGEEKTFDLVSSWANYKYLRLNVSAVGSGTQVEVKEFNLYPYSGTMSDDFHSENHGKRLKVEDRYRVWRWNNVGRQRQLRINNDSLAATDIVAHLRDAQIVDIEGLDTPAYQLTFAYGYGE